MRIGNAVVLMVLAAAAGCASAIPPATWTSTIQPMGGSEVNATAHVTTTAGLTSVGVSMIGGQPGGEHPWHIHDGRCGGGGDIVGDPNAYTPLRPDQDGRATAQSRVRVQLVPGEDYHINIHQSPQQLNVIVGCGNIRVD